MTIAGYLAEGGIDGAVRRTADAVLDGLTPDQQRLARRLFLRLVRVADDGVDTLRRLARSELGDSEDGSISDVLADIIERFAADRLITMDDGWVEISHVALLTAWPQLRSGIDADREAALVARRLADAAHSWDAAGRDAEDLYGGPRLEAVRSWTVIPGHDGGLNAVERAFLRASVERQEAREHEERQRVWFLRRLTAIACVSVTAAGDGTTRIWTLPGPVITDPTSIVFTTQISTDGRWLLVGHDGNAVRDPASQKVRLWDITVPERPVALGPPMGANGGGGLSGAAALSPDQHTVAAGTLGGPVYLWDIRDPTQPVLLPVPLSGSTDNVESVAFSPDAPCWPLAVTTRPCGCGMSRT